MVRNASKNVIGINEKNPHYFQYKGENILLITSAEHYGAVISKKFDYIKYFDMLAEYGLNYTRIYPGAFVECTGKWSPEDNMAPGIDLIVPWARSEVPGYPGGGNKFDLSKWDAEYFARLSDFVEQAGVRGIIVEICFFNCQYDDFWQYSPLHKDANIQGIGVCGYREAQTLDDGPLVKEQLRYVEKIITETNKYDNVIYEFIDESTLFETPSQKVYKWIDALVTKAVETEAQLPKKHLLAQQIEFGVDFCGDDRVSVIVGQYILMGARQVGGVPALENCYCFNKPIEANETIYVGSNILDENEYDLLALSRLESWEFMIGGGAAFNQLNGYYTVTNPSGENQLNRRILNGLMNLRTFMEGLDYIKMTRDTETVRKISTGARFSMISERGRQYAMYIHHSFPSIGHWAGSFYEPNFGNYAPVITLRLPKGSYKVVFIKPETMAVIEEKIVDAGDGDTKITCPWYDLDIAVKIAING